MLQVGLSCVDLVAGSRSRVTKVNQSIIWLCDSMKTIYQLSFNVIRPLMSHLMPPAATYIFYAEMH